MFSEGNVEGWEDCVDAISDRRFESSNATSAKHFVVHLSWDTYKLKSQALTDFEILIIDPAGEPLSDVTYDFTHKGTRDLGEMQDRYVADFLKDLIPSNFKSNIHAACTSSYL